MTPPKATLASLTSERDHALTTARAGLHETKVRLSEIEKDVEGYAERNPWVALGGAAALGVAGGMLIRGRPIRNLVRGAGLFIIGPMVGDMIHRIVLLASGESEV